MTKKNAARTMRTVRAIRTIADLADLPDDELAGCLKGLRQAIQDAKQVHANALAGGTLRAGAPLGFEEYQWRPRQELSIQHQVYLPTTPVSELPIRPRVRFQLLEKRVFVLEDLSAVTENELRCCPDVGATTVTRLRELLQAHGMDFAQPGNTEAAEYQRNRILMRMGDEALRNARAGLPDSAPITRLGLSNQCLSAAKRAGWRTVGDLRASTLRQLNLAFGKASLKEVVLALNDTGQGLYCQPQSHELWSAGMIERSELTKPDADDTPVAQLQPWIGAIAKTLEKKGVATLGALRQVAKDGTLRQIGGVGANVHACVLEFLDMPGARALGKNKKVASVGPTNSVFALGKDQPD